MAQEFDDLDLDFDFLEDDEPTEAQAELGSEEIQAIADTFIEAAAAWEETIRLLLRYNVINEDDETVLWSALKLLDAYQGLLNRASLVKFFDEQDALDAEDE